MPHVSPHVVPKASLGSGGAPHHAADEEKTAVDSSWEEENSTIDQQEMAEKIRLALAEKRRAGTGSTTGTENTTGTGHAVDEPTVEDGQRPLQMLELDTSRGVARLVVEVGPDAGKTFDFKPGQLVLVGRAIENHVVLTDLSVSRKHFELKWDGGYWILHDRGSGNGTLVNGKVEEQDFKLVTGDHVEIGRTTFRFDQPGQPARSVWGEEPSTLAGRRPGGDGERLSAVQTSEFGAPSPQDSLPIPLERKRELPPPRAHSASNQPFASFGAGGFSAPPQNAGNFPAASAYVAPVSGAHAPPHSQGRMPGSASPSKPLATLPGRPPVTGPNSPTIVGDVLVPPRSMGSPLELVPAMQTVPLPPPRALQASAPGMGHSMGPPSPMGGPMGGPIGGPMPGPHSAMQGPGAVSAAALVGGPGHHDRQAIARMATHPGRRGMSSAESGISVSAPRFAPIIRHASAVAERMVPKISRSTKLTLVTVIAGLVLVASLVALAMGISGTSLGSGGTLADPGAGKTPALSGLENTGQGSANGLPAIAPKANGAETAEADKTAADKAAADKAAADKAAADKAVAAKAAADKAAADKAAADKAAADKAAADKAAADKAAADKAVAAKAAADKAAADKAAAAKTAAAKAAAAKAAAAKAAATPIGETEATALLEKAEDLYRKKNFSGAAATLRTAMKGRAPNDELRMTAKLYEDLQRTYAAGTAAGARATEAFTNLRGAARADDKLGKAHSEDLTARLAQMAPKAAAQYAAGKQFEEAFQALRDAERLGSTSSTLQSVRSAIDGHATELYNEAQSLREDDPAGAKALLRKVLKLVDSGSSLYQKASKAISGL